MPTYLTIPETAAAMRVSVGTVRHWLFTGRLQGYKPGKRVLVKQADLEALVDAHAVSELRTAKARRQASAVRKVKLRHEGQTTAPRSTP